MTSHSDTLVHGYITTINDKCVFMCNSNLINDTFYMNILLLLMTNSQLSSVGLCAYKTACYTYTMGYTVWLGCVECLLPHRLLYCLVYQNTFCICVY